MRLLVPLIVVFTKYDELLDMIEAEVQKSAPDDIDDDAFQMQVETTAKSLVQTRCIESIQQVADGTIPHAVVSCECQLRSLQSPDLLRSVGSSRARPRRHAKRASQAHF
jgi:hypothetical protein